MAIFEAFFSNTSIYDFGCSELHRYKRYISAILDGLLRVTAEFKLLIESNTLLS